MTVLGKSGQRDCRDSLLNSSQNRAVNAGEGLPASGPSPNISAETPRIRFPYASATSKALPAYEISDLRRIRRIANGNILSGSRME